MQIHLVEGASLPDSEKAVRQENINLYAKASRDFNPIHLRLGICQKDRTWRYCSARHAGARHGFLLPDIVFRRGLG